MNKKKQVLNMKLLKLIMIGIGILLVIIFIIHSIILGQKKRTCNNLKNDIIVSMDNYVNENNLLPTLNGTSVTIDLNKLTDRFSIKDETVTGTVTYTNYNGEYIKTVEINNADYCSTDDFGKETDKYNSKKNVKVNVYFNYYTISSYNSQWSKYLPSEDISTEETDGVYLPIDSKYLPTIPINAVITEYVRETKTYYSYRDKKWKWYKNNIAYSDYSSTKPNGYTYKDTATVTSTEATEWSLDYPEEFEYRTIKSKTGYQWYYKDGKEKIYWENGKYSTESPGENYKKDNDTAAKMYSYTDQMWRWYNGSTKRMYSSLSSTKPNGYNYKDETTLTYTNWSNFKDSSSLTSDNSAYREEKTDTYSRYLIKYDVYSFAMLDEPVSLEELENILGKSYEEILNDKTLKIEVIFKFQNEA